MPAEYGVPKSKTGLLPWSHVVERLTPPKAYWLATADAQGRPHARPVDGVWLDDTLYFGGSTETRWSRNLAANPKVCIHIGLDYDVVIMHGVAEPLPPVERALAERIASAVNAKYGYGVTAEHYTHPQPGAFRFRPRVVLAWSSFPKDVTRWRIK
jgi:nitroimidazol reductase NimA-like FMN-containing flavoprotein (pyridoxamine 5'-phosphate oxidase superfamily)